MAWNVMDALNKNAAAAVDNTPKARFRTKDISITKMYSNAANFYSIVDIEQLAQDIFAVGLLENLTVVYAPCEKGEYRIIAGERRWRALRFLVEHGHSEFEFASCQIKTPAEEHEEMIQLIIANTYRNKTVADILEEEKKLKETLQYMKDNGLTLQGYKLDSGRLRDVIADMMKMPATKIAQIESINRRLIPELADELKAGRLTFSAAYEISGMEEKKQEELLKKQKEEGLTFKEVKEIKRQQEEEKAAEQIPGQMTMKEQVPGQPEEQMTEQTEEQPIKERMTEQPEKQSLQKPILEQPEELRAEKEITESLPKMKNTLQRKEFIENYLKWPVWLDIPEVGERYYRYDIENSIAIVVKTSKKHAYNKYRETKEYEYVMTASYLTGIKIEWHNTGKEFKIDNSRTFCECIASKSDIIDFLKKYQK